MNVNLPSCIKGVKYLGTLHNSIGMCEDCLVYAVQLPFDYLTVT